MTPYIPPDGQTTIHDNNVTQTCTISLTATAATTNPIVLTYPADPIDPPWPRNRSDRLILKSLKEAGIVAAVRRAESLFGPRKLASDPSAWNARFWSMLQRRRP
jgi:hypothetical protein